MSDTDNKQQQQSGVWPLLLFCAVGLGLFIMVNSLPQQPVDEHEFRRVLSGSENRPTGFCPSCEHMAAFRPVGDAGHVICGICGTHIERERILARDPRAVRREEQVRKTRERLAEQMGKARRSADDRP